MGENQYKEKSLQSVAFASYFIPRDIDEMVDLREYILSERCAADIIGHTYNDRLTHLHDTHTLTMSDSRTTYTYNKRLTHN